MGVSMNQEEKSLREELAGLSPDFPARPLPAPPEGYFGSLSDALLDRWRQDRQRVRRQRRHLVGLSLAAVLTSVAVIWSGLLRPPATVPPPEAINAHEAYRYVIDNLEEFESLIPEEVGWTGEDIPLTDLDPAALEEIMNSLSDEELETLF